MIPRYIRTLKAGICDVNRIGNAGIITIVEASVRSAVAADGKFDDIIVVLDVVGPFEIKRDCITAAALTDITAWDPDFHLVAGNSVSNIRVNIRPVPAAAGVFKRCAGRTVNAQFDRSLETFDSVIYREPGSPAGYFFKGMVHFWIFNLNRDEEHLASLEDLFESAIERGEALLEKDGANAQATFYLGGAYGFRGLAYQRNGSLWNAIWDGRRGYAYLEETIEL